MSEVSRNKATPAPPFPALPCHTAGLDAEAWPTVPSMENWVSGVGWGAMGKWRVRRRVERVFTPTKGEARAGGNWENSNTHR